MTFPCGSLTMKSNVMNQSKYKQNTSQGHVTTTRGVYARVSYLPLIYPIGEGETPTLVLDG